jgi:hypothetical protein
LFLSQQVSTLPSEPGKPIGIYSSSSSIELAWNPPEKGLKCIDSYEIKYKQCNTTKAEKWIPVLKFVVALLSISGSLNTAGFPFLISFASS